MGLQCPNLHPCPNLRPHRRCPNLHHCAPNARVRHRRPPRPTTALRPIFRLPGGRWHLLSARPAGVGCLAEPGFGRPVARPTPTIWASRGRGQLPQRPPSPPAARPPRPAPLARVPPYTPIYARIRGFGALYERVYMQHISSMTLASHSMCCDVSWFHIPSHPQHNCCKRSHHRAMRLFLAPRIRHIYMEK